MAKASYRDAGVDIDAATSAVDRIKVLAKSTRTERVESDLGVFAGFFSFPDAGSERLIVASTDGVGTKLRLYGQLDQWEDAGFDIVSHCTSDILVHGARPMFFLDYVGAGKLDPDVVVRIVSGVTEACRMTGCALLGGETAEMPGIYNHGDLDVVGTIIGEVSRSSLVDGRSIEAGDILLGLSSDGLHTNGFSLVRKLLGSDDRPEVLGECPAGSARTWGELVGTRHRLYFPQVAPLLGRVAIQGMVHITGGGLLDNVPRILPSGVSARIRRAAWDVPEVFRHLTSLGEMDPSESHRAFNMGIGYVLIVRPWDVSEVQAILSEHGEPAVEIGHVEEGGEGVLLD